MCKFFSIVTEPEFHGGQRFYRDWTYRKDHLQDENDSHSLLCKANGLDEDKCNKYEYNPLTREFTIDGINSCVDDRVQVEEWFHKLDYKRICEPLIIKPIIHPFALPKVEQVTDEHIQLLKDWASVRASVKDSVWDSVWDTIGDSVGDSVWDSVWDTIGDSVGDSVGARIWDSVGTSVWACISSFFSISYKYDYSSCIKLWEAGLVASFDGKTWRLHSGDNADVVYTWTPEG
jgi:hypothetical protein